MTTRIRAIQLLIEDLVRHPPTFGVQRHSAGLEAYRLFSAEQLAYVESLCHLGQAEFVQGYASHRIALISIVSLECAAGASGARCKAWFRCIAHMASFSPCPRRAPLDPLDATIYLALAGEFPAVFSDWPDAPESEQVADQVLYGLMTGHRPKLTGPIQLYDNRHWVKLYDAIKQRKPESVREAFCAIADWWIRQYEASDRLTPDLSRFPLFEPAPNAALVIAIRRDKFDVQFTSERHREFYVAALL